MASSHDNVSMAVFCDFENVALGVRDANYEKFDIKPVLERLLLKGSIVVKKAYCDWERYKGFKATMHEANFELIEIPHVRQSGKNSADIRLVVDALDLCYTKSHVNTFVIISGDSDFSPLVSKLRENAKQVIGVGVKQSTSDLLIANCDEFIFYDDLVRESRRAEAKRDPRAAQSSPKRSPEEDKRRKDDLELRKNQAIDMAVETFDALVAERGDSGKIWASMLKEAIKRRKPDFSESYYGFRTFGNLLEEAQSRGLLEFGRDEKSGAYVYRSAAMGNDAAATHGVTPASEALVSNVVPATAEGDAKQALRRTGRGGRSRNQAFSREEKPTPADSTVVAMVADEEAQLPSASMPVPVDVMTVSTETDALASAHVSAEVTPLGKQSSRRNGRSSTDAARKPSSDGGGIRKRTASSFRNGEAIIGSAVAVPQGVLAVPESVTIAAVAPEVMFHTADVKPASSRKGSRKPAVAATTLESVNSTSSTSTVIAAESASVLQSTPEVAVAETAAKRKPAPRSRRPRKTAGSSAE